MAPFRAVILNLKQGSADTDAACEQLYLELEAKGVDVLYDDTDQRPGGKFATADLIGVPWQLTIGPKGVAEGVVELKRRATGEKLSRTFTGMEFDFDSSDMGDVAAELKSYIQ